MFSSEYSTLVKILDTISLIFRFLSISFLIRSLELIAFPPLGNQLLCWVTFIHYVTIIMGSLCSQCIIHDVPRALRHYNALPISIIERDRHEWYR